MGIEDGELDVSNNELFPVSNIGDFGDMPNSSSMDSLFDEMLRDTRACTHTHTCNPPGPDYSHTHTCYHVHTKLVPASSDEKVAPSDDTAESPDMKSKKRPLGNREAVRKYREKKKARTASLEDEVIRLRTINQQLMKRLQGQAVLEAEVARLKCLLVDIRGRIEGEIGSFPYQKTAKSGDVYQTSVNPNLPGSHVMNPCNMQCDDLVYCLHPGGENRSGEDEALTAQGFNYCDFENLQSMGNQNSALNELSGCGLVNDAPVVNGSGKNKRKGGARAARAS